MKPSPLWVLFAAAGTAAAISALAACTAPEDGLDSAGSAEIGQVQSINRRPDGLFDVLCVDGRREVATQDEILANTVCATPHPWPGPGGSDGGVIIRDAGPRPTDGGISLDGGPRPRPDAAPPPATDGGGWWDGGF